MGLGGCISFQPQRDGVRGMKDVHEPRPRPKQTASSRSKGPGGRYWDDTDVFSITSPLQRSKGSGVAHTGAFQRRLQTPPGRLWDTINVSRPAHLDTTCPFCFLLLSLSLLNPLALPFAFWRLRPPLCDIRPVSSWIYRLSRLQLAFTQFRSGRRQNSRCLPPCISHWNQQTFSRGDAPTI